MAIGVLANHIHTSRSKIISLLRPRTQRGRSGRQFSENVHLQHRPTQTFLCKLTFASPYVSVRGNQYSLSLTRYRHFHKSIVSSAKMADDNSKDIENKEKEKHKDEEKPKNKDKKEKDKQKDEEKPKDKDGKKDKEKKEKAPKDADEKKKPKDSSGLMSKLEKIDAKIDALKQKRDEIVRQLYELEGAAKDSNVDQGGEVKPPN